jgi:prepilin-type N-terminal cleavage/methylation domain-containing protein
MKMSKSKKSGFTLVEIMIVVAIIGLLAAIAIPSFVSARTKSQTNSCINNLRQISGGVQQYALDNNNALASAFGSIVPTYVAKTPICKAGGTYNFPANLNSDPTCDQTGHTI